MLANAVADNFESLQAVDWNFLTNIPEFLGHTEDSLRKQYNNIYKICVKRFPYEPRPSVQRIKTFVKENYKFKNVSKIVETRQQELIEYFEEQVRIHNIKDFL